MVGASHRNKLEDHPGQDVEHGAKGGVDERNDRSTTLEPLLHFSPGYSRQGVDDVGPWPKGKICHVVFETGQQVR